jgi:hypothetical protein
LRRLREACGITCDAAGYAIRASESRISRMERGQVSFKTRDVEDLLTLYGITDETERAALVGLAREANLAGWWHRYSDVLPSWFATFVGLEGAASVIGAYEVQFVHGLLQTEAYIHGVVSRGMKGAGAADIDRRVALRLERQKILLSENGPDLHIVLDEAALRRPYGDRGVMRGQFQHLIDVSERSNVRLQIMPFSFGGHAGESGAFTIFSFPQYDLSDVVYLEQITGALFLDRREDVDQYAWALKELQQESLAPEPSRDLLRGLLHLS